MGRICQAPCRQDDNATKCFCCYNAAEAVYSASMHCNNQACPPVQRTWMEVVPRVTAFFFFERPAISHSSSSPPPSGAFACSPADSFQQNSGHPSVSCLATCRHENKLQHASSINLPGTPHEIKKFRYPRLLRQLRGNMHRLTEAHSKLLSMGG